MISSHTLPISLAKDNLKTGLLKFPGKIAINESGSHFAVSNTGNHNILLFNDTGIVYSKIGTGTPGFVDGSSEHAQFNAPQGLTWHGNDLYVADTENHVIRKVSQFSNPLSLTHFLSLTLFFRINPRGVYV